jgi:hypothetical protein
MGVYVTDELLEDGFKGWGNMVLRDGWKCSFIPV